jgi:hypothetical protein
MNKLNSKDIQYEELAKYLAFRTSENHNILDNEIADIFSDENAMILAAENEQCEIINN